MINSVIFNEDFRTFVKDTRIYFDKLTVITGDNGAGKSTLLSCIRKEFKTKWTMSDDLNCKDKITIEVTDKRDIELFYLDTFKDLYSVSPEMDFDNFNLYMSCTRSSGGQGSFNQIADKMKQFKESFANGKYPVIILDEPERGLSLKNQYLIKKLITFLNEHIVGQIIITTHSPVLMELTDTIFSISHMSHITKDDFCKWCAYN